MQYPRRRHRATAALLATATAAVPALPFAGALALLLRSTPVVAAPDPHALPRSTAAVPTPVDAGFRRDVVATVSMYCVSCHTGGNPPGGVNLASDQSLEGVVNRPDLWQRVIANVQSKNMPPPGLPAPSQADRDRLVGALQAVLSQTGCVVRDPGRVTASRLNRAEYVNSVRDLTGVELPGLTDDFPSDEVGYGFDNIGDVLSLSTLHLEKYLIAAGRIARAAIPAPEDEARQRRGVHVAGSNLTGDGSTFGTDERILFTFGSAGVSYKFPRPGHYVVHVAAWEQHAGPDHARMSFLLDGKPIVAPVDVASVDAAHPDEFDIEATVPAAGTHLVAVGFTNDYYDTTNADPRLRGDRNLVVNEMSISPAEDTLAHAATWFERRYLPVAPPPDATPAVEGAAAKRFLNAFLLRAYRRPPTTVEVTRLARIAARVRAAGGSPLFGLQTSLQAALVSPSFLLRIERDPMTADGHVAALRPLNDYELATRLSYFLWSSTPDDRLLALAAQGKLHEPAQLETEASRLLSDPRAAQTLGDNFAAQWLTLRKLDRAAPDTQQFPMWNDNLRNSMRTETLMYFRGILTQDRSVVEFLDSDYTYLNGPLARLYSIPGVDGNDFRLVHLHGGERGGVLSQASVLTVTSNPTRTSPVKRGKWVMENLLGETIPPPPPGVPQLPDDAKQAALTGTLRQRMEQHRSNPACAACHARMDPIGFGLENYNAIGMWRQLDGGQPIDPSGVLTNGQSFHGPADLRVILKGMAPKFVHALSERLLTYALGRGIEPSDRCTVDAVADHVAANGYRFSALVSGIVTSDAFRLRRPEGANAASPAVAERDEDGHRRAGGA
jgi:hypothetical protein